MRPQGPSLLKVFLHPFTGNGDERGVNHYKINRLEARTSYVPLYRKARSTKDLTRIITVLLRKSACHLVSLKSLITQNFKTKFLVNILNTDAKDCY